MTPTLVIVGRPNVGKSTLYNRITGTRDAIVANIPGLTRDRHYGLARRGERSFLVVDTGGFEPIARAGMLHEMAKQTHQAIIDADVVLFVMDGREGLVPHDRDIANTLRQAEKPVWLVVNKAEGTAPGVATAEFHELGLGVPVAISASHGDGVWALLDLILDSLKWDEPEVDFNSPAECPRIAIVGRPNVGKSTLVNALVGEERVIVFDQPGTTRDSIEVDFERGDRKYTLIDTAGMRRRARVDDVIEKFSVVKTLQSIAQSNVAVLVLDAQQGISDQDAHIASAIIEAGRAVVVAVNKWDGRNSEEREEIKRQMRRRLGFLEFAQTLFISATERRGIGELLKAVDGAFGAATAKLSTPRLTRVLSDAVARQMAPLHGITRPKLRYAHQGGSNPPIVVVHGSGLDHLPDSYIRYLEGVFRTAFQLRGTPLRIKLNVAANPYVRTDKRG